MRLAALCQSHGLDLSTVAALCGVNPLLLTNIDAGTQAMPRVLALRIAAVLGEDVANVQVNSVFNTELSAPVMFTARPLPYGSAIAPARIAPAVAPVMPTPVTSAVALWLGIRTEIVDLNVDPIPDAQPLVEITNAAASGAITFASVVLTRTQLLVDPVLASNATFTDYRPPVTGTIVRASADYVWIRGNILDDPAGATTGIMVANNDGSLHALYTPLVADPSAFIIGKDPNGIMWGMNDVPPSAIFSFADPGAPAIGYTGAVAFNGWDKYPTTMMFVSGKLYVGCGASRLSYDNKIGIVEWDPTLGAEAFVQMTPNPLTSGTALPSIYTYSTAGDEFFSTYSISNGSDGADADFFRFDRATLTLSTRTVAEIPDRLPPVIEDIYLVDVAWNAETDKLWFLAVEPLAEGVAFRLLEVERTGGTALRSIEITWIPAGTPAGAYGFLQHDGKLYVRAWDIATDVTGVCVVDMASGVTERTYIAAQTDFPWVPPTNGGTTNLVVLEPMAFV